MNFIENLIIELLSSNMIIKTDQQETKQRFRE